MCKGGVHTHATERTHSNRNIVTRLSPVTGSVSKRYRHSQCAASVGPSKGLHFKSRESHSADTFQNLTIAVQMKSPSLIQSVRTKKLPPRLMNRPNTFSAKLQSGNEKDPWKRWDWFSIHNLIYSLGKETFGKCAP